MRKLTCKNGCDSNGLMFHKMLGKGADHWDCKLCDLHCGMESHIVTNVVKMSEVEKVNYISVGKTVGIYVELNGKRQLFMDKQALLTKLRDEVEGLKAEKLVAEIFGKHEAVMSCAGCDAGQGMELFRSEVLALLEKAGE